MRPAYLLLFTMILAGGLITSAFSSENISPENGIWTGTIGNSKVTACFQRDDDPAHTNQSAYFYNRYSKLITLAPDLQNGSLWLEGNKQNPTGIWEVKVVGDLITGQWSNQARTHKLAISLSRFESISTDSSPDCDPLYGVFNPKVLTEKINLGKEQVFNGKSFRDISAAEGAVVSIELIEKTKTAIKLNTLLVNELRREISAYYSCPTAGELQTGNQDQDQAANYSSITQPKFWSGHWISLVKLVSGDCGGAYEFHDFSYSTFSLKTGNKVNLWEWITNSKKNDGFPNYDSYYFNYAAPEKLNNIITKKAIMQRLAFNPNEANEENNCLGIIKDNTEYKILLSKTGFIFTQPFPHVTQACSDDVEITYGELMPFLTKKGKDAVMTIQENGS